MTIRDAATKFQQALAHHVQGQLAQAERLYQEVIAIAPKHFSAIHYLGGIQYQAGRYEAAASTFDRAVLLDPNHPDARANLGLALAKLGKTSEALASFDQAIALKPDFAEAFYNRGNILLDLGRATDALACFDRAIAAKPQLAQAHNNRGNALMQLARIEGALASFEQAVSIRPDDVEALDNRGNALLALRRYDEAVASFDRALSRAPGRFETIIRRGEALVALRRFDEAATTYARALELQPDRVDALKGRGHALLLLDRSEEALPSCERAVALAPDDFEALCNFGNALLNVRLPQAALASFEHALELRPHSAQVLNDRGNALRELKRADEALESFDRALTEQADFPEALCNRGNALRDLGRKLDALAAYEAVIKRHPEFAEAHNNRGVVLRELRRPEEALASLDRACAMRPTYAAAFNNRGNALLDLKKPEAALASYDRALALKPDFGEAWNNRGNALLMLKRPQHALASFERAAVLEPGVPDPHNNRGNAWRDLRRYAEAAQSFATLVDMDPHFPYALGNLFTCKFLCCDWQDDRGLEARIRQGLEWGDRVVVPFGQVAMSGDPTLELACARIHVGDRYPASPVPIWTGGPCPHETIRVAYLSADFHDHATAYLMAGLFEAHDRSRFEITAISFGHARGGEMRERLVRAFDRFVEVAGRATTRSRQCCASGRSTSRSTSRASPKTAGRHPRAPAGADPGELPRLSGHDGRRLHRLHRRRPHRDAARAASRSTPRRSCVCPTAIRSTTTSVAIAERTPTRAEAGLPEDGFVFCCFNNNYKITPADVRRLDAAAAAACRGSVLWLLEDNPRRRDNLRARSASARGVDAGAAGLRRRACRSTSTWRAIGSPTCSSTRCPTTPTPPPAMRCGRACRCSPARARPSPGASRRSLLRAVGLPELITATGRSYEALALKLAQRRRSLLAAICANGLAPNRACLPAVRHRSLPPPSSRAPTSKCGQRYQRGEPPASFDVEALIRDAAMVLPLITGD